LTRNAHKSSREAPFKGAFPKRFVPEDSDSDVEEDTITTDEWSRRCIELLYATIDDGQPDYNIRIDDVKAKIKATLRWDATLPTFKESFLNFQSQWSVFVDTNRCKHLFAGNKGRKLAVSLITGQLFPPAFKEQVTHIVDICRKTS
jgi:hypothetical protein